MRAACLASMGAVVSLAVPGPAAGDVLPPLPPPPDPGGTIDGVLGALSPPSSGGGAPAGSSDGGTPSGSSSNGGSASGETTTTPPADTAPSRAPAGSPAASPPHDTRAPAVRLKVVSSFVWVARTGRLKVRVTSDERGAVVVSGTVRASRKVVRLRSTTVQFPAAGARVVTVRVPRAGLRRLARARSLRLSLRTVATDVARNRATTRFRRTLTRTRKVAQLRRATRTGARRAVDSRG
jgi:hypothetical protein